MLNYLLIIGGAMVALVILGFGIKVKFVRETWMDAEAYHHLKSCHRATWICAVLAVAITVPMMLFGLQE